MHPAHSLPASGLALQSLTLRHPQAEALRTALEAADVGGVRIEAAEAPALIATLETPRGRVSLSSEGA